jgi:ATP/maltotriose-dependent transcriptional regulator MalT
LSLFEQIGDKSGAARVQLALAELLIDRGANLQAAAIASRAGEEFAQEKAVRYEALADGVLARAFLAQGQLADAQQTIERANVILRNCHDRQVELFVALTTAQVQSALGKGSASLQTAKSLREVLTPGHKSWPRELRTGGPP